MRMLDMGMNAGVFSMNTNIRNFTILAGACLVMAACTPAQRRAERPQSTTTPGLETGITSNNGGGQRALGNTEDVILGTTNTRAR